MRKNQSLVARTAAGAGAALLAAGLIAETVAAETTLSKEAGQVAEKMNQLGGRTLGQLTGERNDATVILSPFGLGSALHLLLIGAASNSKAESSLRTSLLPPSIAGAGKQDPGLKDLNKHVLGANNDKVKLTLASAVFVPTDVAFSERFEARAQDIFKAPVEALDFKSPKALDTINGWVKTSTNEQIPSILDKLEPDARFVLLNAVYFNGAWQVAFDPARTAKAPFTRADKTTREVAMMNATFPVQLAELGELRAVWLPYGGSDVAMLIVAPRAGGAPSLVAETLRSKSIDELIAAARKAARARPVHVSLPRFRAEGFLDITDALSGQIGPALAADSDYGPPATGRSR
jgi:serine protease inhibitor